MNRKKSIARNGFIPPLPNPHFESLIDIISDRQAEIEGCNGIVEYNDCIVSIDCKNFILKINGENLTIKANTRDCLTVNGKIHSIFFSAD